CKNGYHLWRRKDSHIWRSAKGMYTFWRSACFILIAGFAALFVAPFAWASDTSSPTANHPAPWSFSPIGHPQPPAVHQKNWLINPIDAFVLSRLEAQNLVPAPRADR